MLAMLATEAATSTGQGGREREGRADQAQRRPARTGTAAGAHTMAHPRDILAGGDSDQGCAAETHPGRACQAGRGAR